ncbi:MAG: beta-ketoacyl-ACP synthase III [Chloroflexota bacterium]
MANRPALHAQIVGWGMYAPSKVVTNDDLASVVDTTDDWIKSHTGIAQRHIAEPKESTSTLAIRAAQNAIAVADFNPRHIDLVIVATLTPDYPWPSVACLVQDALGIPHAAAFDISAGCTGFVYALSIASRLIAGGHHKAALVIGAETLSRIVDWTDRKTCVLFGDGAGAVLLQATEQPTGLLGATLGSDGSGAELLYVPGGGSKRPASVESVQNHQHYVKMDGSAVYRFAVDAMTKAARGVIEETGVGIGDIELVIPHQANIRIIQAATKALKLAPERVFTNIARYGNTSAASIPIALCEAVEHGRVQTSDHILLVGFGAGLTWGAALIQWGVPTRPEPRPIWRTAAHHVVGRLAPVRSASHRLGLRLRTLATRPDELGGNGNGHRHKEG